MMRIILLAGLVSISGCAAAKVAGAAVSVGVGAAKTTAKAGGAVIDGAVDAVDAEKPRDEDDDNGGGSSRDE